MIAALFIAFFTFASFACDNTMPYSEAEKIVANQQTNIAFKCSEKPQEECLCFDGVNMQAAVIAQEMDGAGIYTGRHILIEDGAKMAAWVAAQAQIAQLNAGLDMARKSQNCGRDTMAYLLVRNASKGLSTAQVDELVSTYSQIKSLLESGSLTTAKEKIAAVTADGALVTNADKAALAAYIDGCKP